MPTGKNDPHKEKPHSGTPKPAKSHDDKPPRPFRGTDNPGSFVIDPRPRAHTDWGEDIGIRGTDDPGCSEEE